MDGTHNALLFGQLQLTLIYLCIWVIADNFPKQGSAATYVWNQFILKEIK